MQGTSKVGEVPNTTGVTGFRLKSEGIKLNIILKERFMNFIHLSKRGCSCLEKKGIRNAWHHSLKQIHIFFEDLKTDLNN